MYPNLKAELARKGFTLEKLATEMGKRGYSRTVPTLSQKLNGKAELLYNEAKAIKAIVAPEIPLESLFEVVQ